jgi:hypothetical protein
MCSKETRNLVKGRKLFVTVAPVALKTISARFYGAHPGFLLANVMTRILMGRGMEIVDMIGSRTNILLAAIRM